MGQPTEAGEEWRRRTIRVLEARGGELRAGPGSYGVTRLLMDAVEYTGTIRSWTKLFTRMVDEGLIVVLDRSEKRVWHIRLGTYEDVMDELEDDLQNPGKGYQLPDGAYVDYERLAWAVMGAAAEAIAKPGRRAVRYKATIARLNGDLIALTQRLDERDAELERERAKNDRLQAQLQDYEMPETVAQVIDAKATDLALDD